MSSNLSEEEIIIKKRLERIIETFNYKYAKANTKSKKKLISGDLVSLSRICEEYFSKFNFKLSWDNDESLYSEMILSYYKFIENIIINQDKYSTIFDKLVNDILNTNLNVYKYYGKDYHRKNGEELEDIFCSFLNSFDYELYKEYINLIDRQNIFWTSLDGYTGQNYPFSILNTNVIFMDNALGENINFYKILSHELGHSYESKLYLNSGRIREYDKTYNSPFYEVPSSFMEYAYINYLLENNIYIEEANMLLHEFLVELLINSTYSNMICKIKNIEEKINEQLEIDMKEFNAYLEEIGNNHNVFMFPINNTVSLKDSFIYGFGQIFSIYMYENYKKDPNNFKKELKYSLLDYSNSEDMISFERVGISYDELIKGDILKRVLAKNS